MKYFIKKAFAMRYKTTHKGKRFMERADIIGDDYLELDKYLGRLGGSAHSPLKDIKHAKLNEKIDKVKVLETNLANAERNFNNLPENAAFKTVDKLSKRVSKAKDILEDQSKIRIDHGEARAILSVAKHKTQNIRGFTEVSAQSVRKHRKKLWGKTEPDEFTGEFWDAKKLQ